MANPPRTPARSRTPTPELLGMVAGRFRALAEPARLRVLHGLKPGPLTVKQLGALTGLGQGNLSKHLRQLHASGFVTRTRRGVYVHYALADERVLALCELMCDRLERDILKASATVSRRR